MVKTLWLCGVWLTAIAVATADAAAPTARPFLSASQRQILRGVLAPHLRFFLSPKVVAPNGLVRTAWDDDNELAYPHATVTEWGYAMIAWILAAEHGFTTQEDAVSRLNAAFGALEALRADPSESHQNLFYFLYDVFDDMGDPLPQPQHWTGDDEYIPSIDNGFMTSSMLIVEGWARHRGLSALAGRAHSLWSTMNYGIFLHTPEQGHKQISHGYTPASDDLRPSVCDVQSDEGGALTWIAFLTESITLTEFKDIVAGQQRWHGRRGKTVIAEAPWFNAMFAWGVRSFSGLPIHTWETGVPNSYAQSFLSAVSAHFNYAQSEGIFYPAFSDAMTQLYNSHYVPPNLSGGESDFSHVTPHALFVPFNLGPELGPDLLAALFDKITALSTDTAGYYHDGSTARTPFGFEAVASPHRNTVGYAGITGQGGRYVFETLSNAYIAFSICNALAIDAGGYTLTAYACEVPGYQAKVAAALGVLYPQSFRVPEDFSSIQSAIDSAIYGDTITVGAGVFAENLAIKKGVTIKGTGGSLITPGSSTDDTIVDGGGGSVRTLSCGNGYALDCVTIQGITFRNGGRQDGSNVYLDRTQALISDCVIRDGRTQHGGDPGNPFGGYGGGIAVVNSSNATITGNLLESNDAWGSGGGIYVQASGAFIARNQIKACHADRGGGISLSAPAGGIVVVRNNLLVDCQTDYQDGGGIFVIAGAPQIHNNTFVSNLATQFSNGQGGALYLSGSDVTPSILNNIFFANRSTDGGAAVHCDLGAAPSVLRFNDAFGNLIDGGAEQNYGNCLPSTGSISSDPAFVLAASGNYRLLNGSPAKDAGFGLDADGSVADMGAYGGEGFPVTYSEWSARYPEMTGGAALPASDFDNDGASNWLEFLAGSHPARAEERVPLTALKHFSSLVATFPQNRLASGGTLTLQGSNDLLTWQPVQGRMAFLNSNMATASIQITLPLEPSAPRYFLRLVTSQ